MFLIFRDAFVVRVAFGMPDFAVVEVVAFDVLFVEGNGRDRFDGKHRGVRAARFCRLGERAGFFHFERVVGADLLDGFQPRSATKWRSAQPPAMRVCVKSYTVIKFSFRYN